MSQRRSLIAAGQQITAVGYEQSSAPAAVEQAQQSLLAATASASMDKPESIASVADRRYDEISQVQQSGDPSVLRCIETGFSNLDYYFNGFAPGSLTVDLPPFLVPATQENRGEGQRSEGQRSGADFNLARSSD